MAPTAEPHGLWVFSKSLGSQNLIVWVVRNFANYRTSLAALNILDAFAGQFTRQRGEMSAADKNYRKRFAPFR